MLSTVCCILAGSGMLVASEVLTGVGTRNAVYSQVQGFPSNAALFQ
jgi:hypothetical protein